MINHSNSKFNYAIATSQKDIHPQLAKTTLRHYQNYYNKPISYEQKKQFDSFFSLIQEKKVQLILDSGCGKCHSTAALCALYPNHLIVGVDKSSARLNNQTKSLKNHNNYLILRADLIDFWRLCHQAGVVFDKNYILYPNPWPKKSDFKKRFHGHPVFPQLLKISKAIEVRSNWLLYLQEFAAAAKLLKVKSSLLTQFYSNKPITLFERKYLASKTNVYKLTI